MKHFKLISRSLAILLVIVASLLPCARVSAAPVTSQTTLAVAIQVSEYTKTLGLSLTQVNGDYPWKYFQIYTLLEEALISDGTPYVEVSDADIAAGKLLASNGSPKYPILFSLATECISDTEVTAIRSYVSAGGFAYVGSSAWTRNSTGASRGNFALATEMGLNSVSTGSGNWINIGDTGSRVQKVASSRLVNHLPTSSYMRWVLPNSYTNNGTANQMHQAWNTTTSGATPLISIEGSTAPFMAIKTYGSGQFIYQAELAPLAGWMGWGDGNVIQLEYGFFRNAIEWAFSAQTQPLIRVSAWPYPYQSAFIIRHDDISNMGFNNGNGYNEIQAISQNESQRNLKGQYFIVTDWCKINGVTVNMTAYLASLVSKGGVIGSHSVTHTAPDTLSYTDAYNNINNSLVAIQGWTGTKPKIWVSPYLGAILDRSFQAISASNIIAAGGEQSVGPFPHYALSMTQEKTHYGFVEVPPTFWVSTTGALLTNNDGGSASGGYTPWTQADIRSAVDYVYGIGGLVAIYDHQGDWWHPDAPSFLYYYMDYALTKSNLWTTTSESIANWWALRNPVKFTSSLVTNGAANTLTITTSGATSSQTALDLTLPQSVPVTVYLNGSPSTAFRQSGAAVKVNSGTAQTVSVAWSRANTAPVAANDSYTTAEDTALTVAAPGVLSNDTDADGDTLTAVKVTNPSHGTVTLNSNGSFTYTPAANYNGADSFTYKANDGIADSNTATVSLTITAVNDAPVAANDTYATTKNTTLTIAAPGVLSNDSDVDSANLTAIKVTDPSHGTVTLNSNGSLTYVPTANYTGSDSFTYKANDGSLNSNIATVSITVSATNSAPVAVNDSYTTAEDTALTVAAPGVLSNDTDADGDTLTAVKVSDPSHGTVTLNSNGSFTYTPAANYNGADSFTYKANDTKADSNTATVSVTITAVNDAPVAVNDAYTATSNTALTVAAPGVLANDTDVDSSSITAVKVTDPSHGSVTLNSNGSFTYTPTTGYTGSDSFTYKANDGSLNSNTATVSITVSAPATTFGLNSGDGSWNVGPAGLNIMRFQNTVASGTLTKLEILFNDTTPNGSVRLGVYADSSGAPGSLLLDAGAVPVANGWVAISGLNLAVTQNSYYWLAFNMQNDNTIELQDGDATNAHYFAGYGYGALPAQYPVNRTADSSSWFVMRATVTAGAANHAPVAVNDSYTTAEDTALTVASPGVLSNDTDADGDALTAIKVTDPSHGTVTLNSNGSFTYTPAANYNGADSFTYKANDTKADSNTATVSITITAVNDAPMAVNDAYTATSNTALTVAAPGVLANDTDVDSSTLTAVKVTDPSHGSVTLNSNGSFTYTPTTGYTGSDSFTYKANDGSLNSNTATVSITVSAATTTFGLNTGDGSWNVGPAGLNIMRFQNTVASGTLTKLEILFNDTTPNGSVRLGVYADNAGAPGSLLLDAGAVTVANGWVAISGLNLAVTQNSYYWLAFNMQNDNTIELQDGDATNAHYYAGYGYGALPAQYPVNRTADSSSWFVMRATVTP